MIVNEKERRENGREYALRNIKQNIIWLELAPGSMVSESELSAELGLSRTPVREALFELSKSKIVEIYPQIGSRVSLIDFKLVEEACFTRLVLEKAIVQLACSMAKKEDLIVLEQNLKLQEFYLENTSNTKFLELDNDFHKALFIICEKQQTYDMINSFTIHFDRVRQMSLCNVNNNNNNVSDHRAIIKAIADRDEETAASIMELHLTRCLFNKQMICQDHPEYFKDPI